MSGTSKIKADEKPKDSVFECFLENVEAINVFSAMLTQWCHAGMGQVVGLNYNSLSFVMRTLRVKDRLQCFSKIQVMESRALELFLKGKGQSEQST